MAARCFTEEAEALQYIITLVYERARIRLHDGKEALIRARLGKRMRALGLSNLLDYCNFLRQPAGAMELPHVVDALATNFTSFLREPDHFRFLVETALPMLLGKARKRFSIWSAACATGEEPFSIAFHLAESFPMQAGWDWRITASDISTKALDKAAQATYLGDRLQTLPEEWVRKYFQKGFGQAQGLFRVKTAVRDRVSFCEINLMCPPATAPYEVIFCRNVMIYFDRPTQLQIVQHLCELLVPQGYLFIGHSESLNGLSLPLRCLRPSYYQKI